MLMPSQKAVQIAQPGRYLSSIREQRSGQQADRGEHQPHSLRAPRPPRRAVSSLSDLMARRSEAAPAKCRGRALPPGGPFWG